MYSISSIRSEEGSRPIYVTDRGCAFWRTNGLDLLAHILQKLMQAAWAARPNHHLSSLPVATLLLAAVATIRAHIGRDALACTLVLAVRAALAFLCTTLACSLWHMEPAIRVERICHARRFTSTPGMRERTSRTALVGSCPRRAEPREAAQQAHSCGARRWTRPTSQFSDKGQWAKGRVRSVGIGVPKHTQIGRASCRERV